MNVLEEWRRPNGDSYDLSEIPIRTVVLIFCEPAEKLREGAEPVEVERGKDDV